MEASHQAASPLAAAFSNLGEKRTRGQSSGMSGKVEEFLKKTYSTSSTYTMEVNSTSSLSVSPSPKVFRNKTTDDT